MLIIVIVRLCELDEIWKIVFKCIETYCNIDDIIYKNIYFRRIII